MSHSSLSSRLSPQAKKAVLRHPDQVVSGLAEVAPAADLGQIRRAIEEWGGQVHVSAGPRLLAFELGAQHLPLLADLEGVVYVSTAETYRP